MSVAVQLKDEILQHLREAREEVILTCERCNGPWAIVGPFELRHPCECPKCGKASVIDLEHQAIQLATELLEQLGPQPGTPGGPGHHGHGHAPRPGTGLRHGVAVENGAVVGDAAGHGEGGCGCGSGGCA